MWATPGDSDSFPTSHPMGGYDPWAVLTFKINKFPPHGVENRGDSDTKGTHEGGDFDRRNVHICQNPHGLLGKGGAGDSH